jgi:drug/metabolite transporter, DME family
MTPGGAKLRVLGAAVLFSTGAAAIKAVSFSGWQVACLRSGVAAVALFALLPETRRRPNGKMLGIGLVYAFTLTSYVLANKLTTAASSIFLQSTAPLYILMLSPWLLKESVRRRDLLYMVALAAGLGCCFIGLEPATAISPNPFLGNVFAVLSGVGWALTMIGMRYLSKAGSALGKEGSAAVAAAWGNAFNFALCLFAAVPFAAAGSPDAAGWADWGIILYLGVFQIGLAYVFLTKALSKVPALEASLLLMFEPVLNPVWAWLVHDERPGSGSLAGGAVILLATLVKSWADARWPPPEAPPAPGGPGEPVPA